MNAWLLSIVGVVALGVLLEILLADGETAKYIKGVFALAVVLVLVAPLPKFLNKDFDIGEFFGTEITTQTTFINSVNERKNADRENKILLELQKKDISADRVRIYYWQEDIDDIDVVKVYLSGNVNKDIVYDAVQKFVNCDKEDIRIYNSD